MLRSSVFTEGTNTLPKANNDVMAGKTFASHWK
ncbi:hypothetical protein FIC_02525 [Flavobacteriaceae bacterium 3519-10]|nr:hypothetical protein FIC_02525 [Flavobacteriaceae bacterium 3519-10]